MDYMNLPKSPFKLIEGWLHHKGTHDSKWVQYWCVIKEFTFYIFKSQDTSRENHIGVLQLGSDTRFRSGESDEKKGYRFDLYTTKRLNKFRTTKFSERELWKAYIVGLAQGDVSDSLDLLPGQIHKIRDDIQRVRCKSQNPPLPISPSRIPPDSSSVGTGFSSPDNSITSIFPDNQSNLMLDNGGPMIRHRFWRDPDSSETPTWFFAGITRDIAEKILTSGCNYGNTLMRESITFRDTGSYVITKKMEHARGNPYNHFEVIRIAEGFKINVENAHKSILCLSEVMDYFVTMSGAAVTRPLITNDLKALGLEAPDYQTRIESKKTNPDSGEEYQAEDYEEPDVKPTRSLQSRKGGHTTWSPQKSFPENRGPGSSYGGRTVSGSAPRPRSSIAQVQQGVAAANVIHNLDSAIDHHDPYRQGHYHHGSSEKDEVGKLGPAPPPPCTIGRRQSQPDMQDTLDFSRQDPVKPLHARWQSRTKSVPNLGMIVDLSYLNKQVPVPNESPNLVSPSRAPYQGSALVSPTQTPHRPLPKPPEQEDIVEETPMSGLQQQLLNARLRPTGGPNKKDGKSVSFADTPSDGGFNESGATDKEGIKARLEQLFSDGVKLPTGPPKRMSGVPAPAVSQAPEEEEYDEVLYEPIDQL